MIESKPNGKNVFIVGPTESLLTRRGNRHPALAQFLVERGYRLEYVTSDFYHAEKRWFSADEIDEARKAASYELTVMRCLGYRTNVSLRRVLSNTLLSLKFFFYLLSRVNRQTVLILPSRPVEMIFAAALLRVLRGTSVVLDIQDVWPDGFVRQSRLKSLLFTIHCNMYLYPSLRFIDKAIHVAPSFVSWLHRYAPRGRSVFVPLGFDTDRWAAVPSHRARSGGDPIRLVCVAQLQHAIDIMPILEAINKNDRFHFTLIGDDGQGERYPEVIHYIEQHQMENVTILGRIEPSRMGEYLADADVGLVPMIANSIPNKVFDYVASYLPIVVLGENDSARFVEKMEIGWSCPYNAEGMKTLLRDLDHSKVEQKRKKVAATRHLLARDCLFETVLDLVESDEIVDLPADMLPPAATDPACKSS